MMPPLTGVAVKVMLLPAQIVVLGVAIVTDGVTVGLTVICSVLDVAVVGEAQVTLLVSTQVIASLLTKLLVV